MIAKNKYLWLKNNVPVMVSNQSLTQKCFIHPMWTFKSSCQKKPPTNKQTWHLLKRLWIQDCRFVISTFADESANPDWRITVTGVAFLHTHGATGTREHGLQADAHTYSTRLDSWWTHPKTRPNLIIIKIKHIQTIMDYPATGCLKG